LSTFKKSKLKPAASSNNPPNIPKELADKWAAIEAIATTHSLLQKGAFTRDFLPLVNASLLFIQKLHEQTVLDAIKHPSADMIPGLKALKEEDAKNGETTQTDSGTDNREQTVQ
jgi:hypothetical protein